MANSKIHRASPRILESIRLGLSYRRACQSAGVTYRTFCNWRARGFAELDRIAQEERNRELKKQGLYKGKVGSTAVQRREKPFVVFVEELEAAIAEAEENMAAIILKAANGYTVTEKLEERWEKGGKVVKRITRELTKETGPDWRAAGYWLDRHGWKLADLNLDAVMQHLTDEELRRIEDGDDPAEVIAAILAARG